MAALRWASRASRSLSVSVLKASCDFIVGEVGERMGVVGLDGNDVSRPATNMTGASWAKSSGGYEFMVISGDE